MKTEKEKSFFEEKNKRKKKEKTKKNKCVSVEHSLAELFHYGCVLDPAVYNYLILREFSAVLCEHKDFPLVGLLPAYWPELFSLNLDIGLHLAEISACDLPVTGSSVRVKSAPCSV